MRRARAAGAAQDQDQYPTSKALVYSPGTAESGHLYPAYSRGARTNAAPETWSGQALANTSMVWGGVLITSQAPGDPGIWAKASPGVLRLFWEHCLVPLTPSHMVCPPQRVSFPTDPHPSLWLLSLCPVASLCLRGWSLSPTLPI